MRGHQDDRFAVLHGHTAGGLFGQLARFERQRLLTDLLFNSNLVHTHFNTFAYNLQKQQIGQ